MVGSGIGVADANTSPAVRGRTEQDDGCSLVQLLEFLCGLDVGSGDGENIPVPSGTTENSDAVGISVQEMDLNSATTGTAPHETGPSAV